MTMDKNSSATPNAETDSGDLFNTAAGWVLFAAGLGLGLSIVSGKVFHGNDPQRPESLGYVIEVAEADAGDSGPTLAEVLNTVTAADGERVFAKCAACHSIDAGGANGVGPNLHGIMGAPVGKVGGYSYSSAMSTHGGNWGWDEMNDWLDNPRGYISGTKMGFAGLSKLEDRAAVAVYMNDNGSNIALPEFVPAEVVAEDDAEAEAEVDQNVAEGTSEQTAAAES
ncbi:MAG: cytochrome c family protein [Erythrobacter sp.]|nr:cytochrome c family protein [Erythrobacter sp.]